MNVDAYGLQFRSLPIRRIPENLVKNTLQKNDIENIGNSPSLANKLTPGDWPGVNVPPGIPAFVVVCDVYAIPINNKELSCPANGEKFRVDDMSKPAFRGFEKQQSVCIKSHLRLKGEDE